MALLNMGVIATDVVGKFNGMAFRRSKNGQQLIVKSNGGSRQKLLQNRSLSLLSEVRAQWRRLSDEDKYLWGKNAVNYPFPNKFGVPTKLSAYMFFVKTQTLIVSQKMTLIEPWIFNITVGEFFFNSITSNFLASELFIDITGNSEDCFFLISAVQVKDINVSPNFLRHKTFTVLYGNGNIYQNIFPQFLEAFQFASPGQHFHFYVRIANKYGYMATKQWTVLTIS